jgi:predicted RecA/RadA family phage recombinase
MAKNYIQLGGTITLAAPYQRNSGQGARIGALFGVAANDVANGAMGEFHVEGVWALTKSTGAGTALVVGGKAYWDDTARAVTGVAASNLFIGHALAVAADGATSVSVRLIGGGI